MRVTLLAAVMHHGEHLDARRVVEVDDVLGESWISRGLATPSAPEAADAAPAPRDPIAVAQMAERPAAAEPAPDSGDDLADAVSSEPGAVPAARRRRR